VVVLNPVQGAPFGSHHLREEDKILFWQDWFLILTASTIYQTHLYTMQGDSVNAPAKGSINYKQLGEVVGNQALNFTDYVRNLQVTRRVGRHVIDILNQMIFNVKCDGAKVEQSLVALTGEPCRFKFTRIYLTGGLKTEIKQEGKSEASTFEHFLTDRLPALCDAIGCCPVDGLQFRYG